MNLVHHPMPARSAGKMQEILSNRAQSAKKSTIDVIFGGGLNRPVNHNWAAHNSVAIHKTPIPAVPATIAIVTHYEIITGRNDEFAAANVTKNLFRPFRTKSDFDEIAVGGRKIIAEGIFVGRVVDHIWLRKRIAIYVHVLIDDANAISRQTDHALYVVRMIVEREFEDHDVAPPDGAIRKELFIPGAVSFENKLVHQQMISDQQRRLHRLRRNFKCLHDESSSEKSKKDSDQKRLSVFRKRTAFRQWSCALGDGSRNTFLLRYRSICFHELLQAVPLFASRISSAVLAAPCSASFL